MAYRVKVIAVGKIKQRFYKDAINEYIKRLSPFCKVYVEEIEELGDPVKEGDNILRSIEGKDYLIALDERGEVLSSTELAKKLEVLFLRGKVPAFILGGVRGISEKVRECSFEVWSLSKLTFTHELARLVLLEQIYRAFKIMKGEPYHY